MNEIYLNMYRVAVSSGRLPIEFIPQPYQNMIRDEMEAPTEE